MADDRDYRDRDYRGDDSSHHLRRDVHEAFNNASLAKLLSTLALIAAGISLALSMWAINKASDAQSLANQAKQTADSAAQK